MQRDAGPGKFWGNESLWPGNPVVGCWHCPADTSPFRTAGSKNVLQAPNPGGLRSKDRDLRAPQCPTWSQPGRSCGERGGGTRVPSQQDARDAQPPPHSWGTEGSGLGTLQPLVPAPRGRCAHHGGVQTPRVLAAPRRPVPVPTESPVPDSKMVVCWYVTDKGLSRTVKARPLTFVCSPDCTVLTPAPSIGQGFSSHPAQTLTDRSWHQSMSG